MTRQEIIEREVIEDMLQWSSDKMYDVFGPWLETIVIRQKEKLQLKLRTIWRNRTWYAFHETGEQFDKDTMLFYFNPRKLKSYSLDELESIIKNIERTTIYSNPKKS